MEQYAWLKLDNAAKIYPPASTSKWMALFRVSAELTEPIDPKILKLALASTLDRFPSFAMRLRGGMFWYYLEHIDALPDIESDVKNPCIRMNFKKNKGFMFRVRYHNNRIAVEIYHVLTDGTGGLCFLKTLVAEYLRFKYGADIPRNASILDCEQLPKREEFEDSFLRFAGEEKTSFKEAQSYLIKGVRDDRHYMNIITGIAPSEIVQSKAKEYGASVTVFLTAVLIESICEFQKKELRKTQRRMPVKICIPINLRRFFPSVTLRNFASYANPGIEPRLGDYEFKEIVDSINHQLALEINKKRLNAKFTSNVLIEKNKLMRLAPLFIKKYAMRVGFMVNGDKFTSSIISNLGLVTLPPEMSRYVNRIDFMLGSLSVNPVTCACLSYNGSMMISFTRTIIDPKVERGFFTRLVKMGIPVKVESNQR
ncbi:MAG: hypothetical protein RRY79_06920 [Clostridia bacterium]